jgi:hypothetical protein
MTDQGPLNITRGTETIVIHGERWTITLGPQQEGAFLDWETEVVPLMRIARVEAMPENIVAWDIYAAANERAESWEASCRELEALIADIKGALPSAALPSPIWARINYALDEAEHRL